MERKETKEEIIAAIKKCAAELGHAPTVAEVRKATKLTKFAICRHFANFEAALSASGLIPKGPGYAISEMALFVDWAGLVRKLGRVPTMTEYEIDGRYSIRPMKRRYKGWIHLPAGMLEFARKNQLEGEWGDVLDVVSRYLALAEEQGRTSGRVNAHYLKPHASPEGAGWRMKLREDQPVYGTPLLPTPLSHSPTNELGVVFLFGVVARELGFMVMRLQAAFPDCEAMHEVEPGRWQRVRIEFEYESRNFVTHMHTAEDCDLIVCWSHNWVSCPLDVLELKTLPMLAGVVGKTLTAD
jgi:AcrR family transcriptional regulator